MFLSASAARVVRLFRVIDREGIAAVAGRQARRAVDRLTERFRIVRLASRRWVADTRPVFLMISHHCGGGTERHVSEMAGSLRAAGARAVFVRPSGRGHVLWEERDDDGRVTWCRRSTREGAAIDALLSLVRPNHAHVHHMMGLPDGIVELLSGRGISYDWTIHDYYTICPRVNLIDGSGRYCGEPDAGTCERCLARLGDDQGRPVTTSIAAWRGRHGRLLAGARRVYAPSEDVRRRLARHFPAVRVLVRPHPEELPELASLAERLSPGEKVRVAILGTIVAVKGSERLLACARDAESRQLSLEFHVIGATDRDAVFARMSNVTVGGRYPERDVYQRIARARCHLAFLPSLCPESFMYALSVAMAARLFVFCFDLGAQAERLRAWGWGQTVAIDAGAGEINDALVAAARSLAGGPPAPAPPRVAAYPDILSSYYDFTIAEIAALKGSASEPDRPARPRARVPHRRDHARLH
jgi:glycosyltransferase involved in cell wall biosynthesis